MVSSRVTRVAVGALLGAAVGYGLVWLNACAGRGG
jgi:hypothetical protein